MSRFRLSRTPVVLALATFGAAPAAFALQRCDLNGESVNPANGYTTQGKTGLMRCRDADTGQLQREEELRNGQSIGVRRFYENGVLMRDGFINDKGNTDGLQREYDPKGVAAGAKPPLVSEATYRNGTTIGLARRWHTNGTLRRATFYGDDGREQASAEFNANGQLQDLRCADRPLLAPAADDAAWCGHQGRASNVELHDSQGRVRQKASYVQGERRRYESLWENGKPASQETVEANASSERRFNREGVMLKESEWTGPRRERRLVVEREFHESGPKIRERRFATNGRFNEVASDETWYLNGQPKSRIERTAEGVQRETRYHDTGRIATVGEWTVEGRGRSLPRGTHQSFDEQGRLRGETFYDTKGVAVRERQLDEAGRVLRDDELFADGSRKAFAR